MLRLTLACCIVALFSPKALLAEEGGFFDREKLLKESQDEEDTFEDVDESDFFGLDEERLLKKREKQAEAEAQDPNQKNFLKALNKIRGKDDEAEKKGSKIWGEFEDVSGKKPEKAFLESKEVEVWRELRKPIPRKPAFGDKIDDLEEAVNSLRTPNYSGKNPPK